MWEKFKKYHNIHVVYTKEAETADQYIEKTVQEIGKKYHVTVATSDALEQMIEFSAGSVNEFSERAVGGNFDSQSRDSKRAFESSAKYGITIFV